MYVCLNIDDARAGRPGFFLEPVPFTNPFIGTGFCLENRFKVNKKSKIKVKFEVFLINRFENGTSSINRFDN